VGRILGRARRLPRQHLGECFYGNGTIRVADPQNASFARIFDSNLSYNKASWVPHMLRGMFGDTAFFQFCTTTSPHPISPMVRPPPPTSRPWPSRASGAISTTSSRAGSTNAVFPDLPLRLHPVGPGNALQLDVEQIQTQGLYTMPIRVRVVTASGSEDFVVQDSLATQTFMLQPARGAAVAEPGSGSLDPVHDRSRSAVRRASRAASWS
jgi:hypothetical protein